MVGFTIKNIIIMVKKKVHQIKVVVGMAVLENKVMDANHNGGMTNVKFNVIIATNLTIMPFSVIPKGRKRVNFADNERTKEDVVLLLSYDDSDTDNLSTWYLDMGASNHLCK